ncbi:hypothetical protein BDV96DRAFT_500066 [Lophiotrema nucula]|uniref:Polyketide cyclase n=1 Tax=Lophiotrema nucula TaxID=690887 RepID=A0A6A5YXJ1_9PLEO|nr:hypothetical protein BDV96DRAFT_500066 [Lophiotrema nucula]
MTTKDTAPAIIWPEKYLPGTTDNYVSNEVIVKGISTARIWAQLVNITKWESYYDNVSEITPPNSGPKLKKGDDFSFSTFGFPPLQCRCEESIEPSTGKVGRLAWSAKQDGSKAEALDVYHAWLVEDLGDGRVRILTQESQIGDPAAQLAGKKPNPMLNGHQDWLDGLVKTARDSEQ